MTTFDDREKAQERHFIQNEEIEFKVQARTNKLLGLWAAEKLGKSGDSAEAYAKEVVVADFEKAGSDDVIAKVAGDFSAAGVAVSADAIAAQREQFVAQTRKQFAPEQ